MNETRWFRHRGTGDRGFLVEEDEQQYIQFDRPQQVIRRKYQDSDWVEEKEVRRLTQLEVARIAFEADKRLCYALGLMEESKRDWLSLREKERADFVKNGPLTRDPVRIDLHGAIRDSLGSISA